MVESKSPFREAVASQSSDMVGIVLLKISLQENRLEILRLTSEIYFMKIMVNGANIYHDNILFGLWKLLQVPDFRFNNVAKMSTLN